jgi:hypothetical protein
MKIVFRILSDSFVRAAGLFRSVQTIQPEYELGERRSI